MISSQTTTICMIIALLVFFSSYQQVEGKKVNTQSLGKWGIQSLLRSKKCPRQCRRSKCNKCLLFSSSNRPFCLSVNKKACLRGKKAGIWCGGCKHATQTTQLPKPRRRRTPSPRRKCKLSGDKCRFDANCCDCDCFKRGTYPLGCVDGTCSCAAPRYAFCRTAGDCPSDHCANAKPGLAEIGCLHGSCECVGAGKCKI